jgi:hypothetical protein
MSALLGIAMDINERIRSIQRRERVNMIATRVRKVPQGMNIVKDGREFVMDDHFFREREIDDRGHSKARAGKTLPLADFVCLPSSFSPLSSLSLSLFLTSLSLSLSLALSLSRSLSLSLSGYRDLYLFNDAVLVCKPARKPGEGILGQLFKANDCDLKFKRLIPLTSLKISDYPTLCEPSAPGAGDSPESPGWSQTTPYFELHDGLGKCAFHHTDRFKRY